MFQLGNFTMTSFSIQCNMSQLENKPCAIETAGGTGVNLV